MKTTKQQTERLFKSEVLPSIISQYEQDGKIDKPARRQAWNDFTDMLCKDGQITENQYMNWRQPKICH